MRKRKTQIEHHPLGPDVAADLAVQLAIRETKSGHNPLPLAIALQFYDGDQDDAVKLARFMADIEKEYRDDVILIFASRFDGVLTKKIKAAMAYCSLKFPVTYMRSARRVKGYPDGSYGTWVGIAERCYQFYSSGMWNYHSVFFCECDGAPLKWDWIDEIKKAHEENLRQGKRVTGARMWEHGDGHIQGSLVMHLSCLADHPSLKSCPTGKAWDMYHAQVLIGEAGQRSPIAPQYGTRKLSRENYVALSHEFAWLPAAKDETALNCARKIWLPKPTSKRGKR